MLGLSVCKHAGFLLSFAAAGLLTVLGNFENVVDVPVRQNPFNPVHSPVASRRSLRGVVFRDVEGKGKSLVASYRPFYSQKHLATNQTHWTFKYPYNSDGTCGCEKVNWGEYVSKDACIVAYSESDFEDCILPQGFQASSKTRRLLGDTTDSKNCDFAVATNLEYSNKECHELCIRYHNHDGDAFRYFEGNCKMEYYLVSSRVPKTQNTNCFDNWIYGNSDDYTYIPDIMLPFATRFGYYKMVLEVLNAAACQSLCQEDMNCIRWFWRRSPLVGPNGDAVHGETGQMFSCYLRDYTSTVGGMETLLTAASGISDFDMRWRFCNLHKTQGCLMPPGSIMVDNTRCKECAICKCQPKCVWKSTEHVSGPKHCGNPTPLCEKPVVKHYTYPPPAKVYTTSAPPSSQPIVTPSMHPTTRALADVGRHSQSTSTAVPQAFGNNTTSTSGETPPPAPVGGIVTGALAALGGVAAVGGVVYKGWIGASMVATSSAPPLDFTPRFVEYDESLMRDHEQFQPVEAGDFN